MKTVLFVCVQNSCRSQMAEGFARSLGRGIIEPHSAGSKPSGKINPMAIEVMREKGIDISGQASKGFSDLPIKQVDYLVTMGCQDVCPIFPTIRQLDWKLDDPAGKPIDEFRRVRDQIEARVRLLIEEIESGRATSQPSISFNFNLNRDALSGVRDYPGMANAVARGVKSLRSDEERLELVTNQLWAGLKDKGLSWVGFYKMADNQQEMLLVCRQPKPACSPIGLHGVCGKAWKERKAQVVTDVQALGKDHIVCDPANRSEVVVPLIEKDGGCRYLLDLDSRELNAFGPEDVAGLELVLRSAGL